LAAPHWVCIVDGADAIADSEEAQWMWAQQEQKWNLECEARERLMTEVLVILQRQLEEKLEANLAEQRELVRSREALVARVEQANVQLQGERAAINRLKEAFKKDLDIQVLGIKDDCRFFSPLPPSLSLCLSLFFTAWQAYCFPVNSQLI
jgi:hypothetical protein